MKKNNLSYMILKGGPYILEWPHPRLVYRARCYSKHVPNMTSFRCISVKKIL